MTKETLFVAAVLCLAGAFSSACACCTAALH